jgi:hypothetical protein
VSAPSNLPDDPGDKERNSQHQPRQRIAMLIKPASAARVSFSGFALLGWLVRVGFRPVRAAGLDPGGALWQLAFERAAH